MRTHTAQHPFIWLFLSVLALLLSFQSVLGQTDLQPCLERPTFIDPPWINGTLWCLEQVIALPDAGDMAFTALAAAPNGTLYATRPFPGEVWALDDTNGNGLPDTPRLVEDHLERPNGLVFYDGALYVSGASQIYRIQGETITTLVDDLPSGTGFWTGGLTVGPDERIYVGIGAPCDACVPDNPLRGTILSFALDGSDRQVIATGLRHPADVAFLNGTLWTIDTARDSLFDTPNLDELNRVTPGADFGWPYCIGVDNRPDWPESVDCSGMTPPALALPTHSTPVGLAAYESDTFPNITGTLLIVLHGPTNKTDLRDSYSLAVVTFNADGVPDGYTIILPEQADKTNPPGLTTNDIQYQGSGLWPHAPLGVAVSPDGWIYLSVTGGTIYTIRPG
ncbi:MAG: PQQ-dependent sugar dehydrogenase [Anaerolineaceae bacterium]|nr:PQQ-dependent sugar dehydrogenase [Anaerolineaceae bacterium]